MLDRIAAPSFCALAVALVLPAGCATARYVKQTPTGGTIRLEGPRDDATKQARQMMGTHCHDRFTIVSGGEVITGTENERRQATTLTYVCDPSVAPPPGPVAGAPDGGPPPR